MYQSTHNTSSLRKAWFAWALLATFCLIQSVRADDEPTKEPSKDVPLKFTSWGINLHTEYPGATGESAVASNGNVLKLSYDFSKGGSFISAGTKLDSKGTYPFIEIKARGPGGLGISVVDAGGQLLVYQLGAPGDVERTFEVDLSTPSAAYGGAKDKVPHFPLQSMDVMISKVTDPLAGRMEITGLTLKGTKP